MIYFLCSKHQFPLNAEYDVSDILVFLVRAKEDLSALFSDSGDSIVQHVRNWVLKECDVTKDMEVNSLVQITLPDMQMPLSLKVYWGIM